MVDSWPGGDLVKNLWVVVFLLVLGGEASAYGYKHIDCTCPDNVSSPVDVRVGLVNSGGMNIFYFSTDGDQITQNIYSNITKSVVISGNTDSGGIVGVDVSTNYNDNFILSCLWCGERYSTKFWNTLWFTGLMGLAGLCIGALIWWAVLAAHLN